LPNLDHLLSNLSTAGAACGFCFFVVLFISGVIHMIVIHISNASLVLGAHTIFDNLYWEIQHDQKIGLIGPNGAGKSSLLKLIVGEYTPEAGGGVVKARCVGWLSGTEVDLEPDQLVWRAASNGNPLLAG
jgi:ATPase subunit of ABC transporter with duplicated ATPase domains